LNRATCDHCQQSIIWKGARGKRICDTDCPYCGRKMKAGIKARPTKGKRFGYCGVCGHKRLESRYCPWHSKEAIEAVERAKAREGVTA